MTIEQFHKRIQTLIPNNKGLASFIFVQGLFESGRLTSPLFINNNNAFGMTYVKQTLANGYTESVSPIDKVKRKWAKYDSVDKSILDRLRLAKVKKYENETEFDNIFTKVINSCYLGCPPNPNEVRGYKNGLQKLRNEFIYLDNNNISEDKTEISKVVVEPIQIILTLLTIYILYDLRIRK